MKLNEILNIKYPIIQGGMANISNGEFAAKVSEAGALGVIGSGGMNYLELEREIKKCKSITNKPFGVNLMLLNPEIDKFIDLIIDLKVDLITTGAGNPAKYLEKLKENNIKIFPVVSTVTMAKRMEKLGVDGVIVEGNEAGGHIGEMTTMTLLPQVSEALKIPIVAAGGIASGRQILAAKVLGACGVQMGSIFLSSEECPISNEYKTRIIRAKSNNITVIGRINGVPIRLLKSPMVREYIRLEKLGKDKMELEKLTIGALKRAVNDGDWKEGSFMVGNVVEQIEEIRPLREILGKLEAEYLFELESIKNGD